MRLPRFERPDLTGYLSAWVAVGWPLAIMSWCLGSDYRNAMTLITAFVVLLLFAINWCWMLRLVSLRWEWLVVAFGSALVFCIFLPVPPKPQAATGGNATSLLGTCLPPGSKSTTFTNRLMTSLAVASNAIPVP